MTFYDLLVHVTCKPVLTTIGGHTNVSATYTFGFGLIMTQEFPQSGCWPNSTRLHHFFSSSHPRTALRYHIQRQRPLQIPTLFIEQANFALLDRQNSTFRAGGALSLKLTEHSEMAHQQFGFSTSRTPSLEPVTDSEPEWDKIESPTRPQSPADSSSPDASPPPEMSQKVILPPRPAAAAGPTAFPAKPATVQTPTLLVTPATNVQNSLRPAGTTVQASTGTATPAVVVSPPTPTERAPNERLAVLRRIAESALVRRAGQTGSAAEESSRTK
jgi:hypothetical protein